MSRKLYLHIGASKTGSSAIQTFMRLNNAWFAKQGFTIPDRELGVSRQVTGEHVWTIQQAVNDNDSAVLTKAFANLDKAAPRGNALLLSAENLSNLGNHALLKDALEPFDTKVILYIRRQDDLLSSAWQQWYSKIKTDLNAWTIGALGEFGQWMTLIEDWESVVGKGNVDVRIFQRADMVENDLLRDFLAALGLDPLTSVPNFETGEVNPSYSDIITPLVTGSPGVFRSINDNEFYSHVGRLTQRAFIERRKVSLYTQSQREAIVAHYAPVNIAVCKRFFPGRERLFDPLQHAKYQYLNHEELVDRQLKFLTHMVFKLARQTGPKQ